MSVIEGKHVVLGVTGSIAAYKAVELARRFTQAGALVDVILTEGAQNFVSQLTFASLTDREVVTSQWDADSELSVRHVRMAERADLLVVAPATAHVIAKLALGLADDPLTSTALATSAPLVIAPAMENNMLAHPATQQNLRTLVERGAVVVESEVGELATGRVGKGRLATTEAIMGHAAAALGQHGPLAGRRVLVTAGGTQEPIDPVRRLTNRSSGKMGYAIAVAARDAGAQVTLVAGPTGIPDPPAVETIHVTTAQEMHDAVLGRAAVSDVVIKAAAVADFRVADVADQKIKRAGRDELVLRLIPNPDIAAAVGKQREGGRGPSVLVVFAAESDLAPEQAREKLSAKNADLLVLNDITASDAGFEVDTNRVTLFARDAGVEAWPLLAKAEVAERIVARVASMLERVGSDG